jgi:hypothetical protein
MVSDGMSLSRCINVSLINYAAAMDDKVSTLVQSLQVSVCQDLDEAVAGIQNRIDSFNSREAAEVLLVHQHGAEPCRQVEPMPDEYPYGQALCLEALPGIRMADKGSNLRRVLIEQGLECVPTQDFEG